MFFDKLFGRNKKSKVLSDTGNNPLEAVIRSLMKNEIRITGEEESTVPGASRIGGKPYVPSDFSWPVYEHEENGIKERHPLSFLCQINLNEVRVLDTDGLLPNHGMLSFFYDVETMPWGFDPKDKGCARVFWFEDTADFILGEYPDELDAEYCADEMRLVFSSGESYPDFEEFENYSELDADYDDYDEILDALSYDTEIERHKLLGYANLIQSECLTECEMCYRGIYNGNPDNWHKLSNEEKAEIKDASKEWLLLFQMASIDEEGCPLMWGDLGNLYFYIRKEDLAKRDFDKTWLVLQCG